MLLHAQTQKMKQVVQVALPVRLRIGRQGQVFSRLLARDAKLDALLVERARVRLEPALGRGERFALRRVEVARAPLAVRRRLHAPSVRLGRLGGVDRDGIAGRIFVYGRGPMPNPLAPRVHRNAHEQLDFRHFERGSVPVAHEIADKGPVVGDRFRSLAVTYARGLYDRVVGTHDVDEADKSVVQDGELFPAQRFQSFLIRRHVLLPSLSLILISQLFPIIAR